MRRRARVICNHGVTMEHRVQARVAATERWRDILVFIDTDPAKGGAFFNYEFVDPEQVGTVLEDRAQLLECLYDLSREWRNVRFRAVGEDGTVIFAPGRAAECCDVLVLLADLTFFFHGAMERNEGRPPPRASAPLPPPFVYQDTPYRVTQGEISWWWECVNKIHATTEALIAACEDLVEQDLENHHLVALKSAVARAQGQEEYYPRCDRW